MPLLEVDCMLLVERRCNKVWTLQFLGVLQVESSVCDDCAR
jgi:hypothetical protein